MIPMKKINQKSEIGNKKTDEHYISIARGLLDQPTAPLMERLPAKFIHDFVKSRPALKLSQDSAGNLLVKYSGPDVGIRPPLVYVAHLDHPGFWVQSTTANQAKLVFKGGVHASHARAGSGVQFFEDGKQNPTGTGKILQAASKGGALTGAVASIDSGKAVSGGFAMWDFPGFSIENELIESIEAKGMGVGESPGRNEDSPTPIINNGLNIVARCCDDLLGAAAALCALDELSRVRPKESEVWGLFTRAEEVGFYGTLEAIRQKTIPFNASVVSLECSKAFSNAPQGDGVIVRVGDRASIFDPTLTAALHATARDFKKKHPLFQFQRKLMDGGSCEATAFCAYGFRASGLALPLGNYHNQAFDLKGIPAIGPETVRVDDFLNEVMLLIELSMHPDLLQNSIIESLGWLEDLTKKARAELASLRI